MTITIDGTVGANKAVVLDSAGKLPAIDGSLVTTLNATQVTTGSIATARLDTGTTNGKVLVLDGSGNMPAIAAGAMTGVEAATKSSRDPTISTNSALGTKWINTTTGDIFILTDATTGANVWTNTGGTSGDVQPYIYQGTQYGYEHGGEHPANSNKNSITKYSFTADGNSVDVADLTATGAYDAGMHSGTHGYRQGAEGVNVIDKYTFATDANATDVGDMSVVTNSTGGLTSQLNGYVCGGYVTSPSADTINKIQRVSFSTDGNAVDVADMATTRIQPSMSTDTVNGYIMCGAHSSNHKVQVDKFVYATEANATDIGDMTTGGYRTGGSSSLTHGYGYGGNPGPGIVNVIDKFNFSGYFTATDVGNLAAVKMGVSSSSSTAYGYCAGGNPPAGINVIEKVNFSADGNSTDVGDLIAPKDYGAGTSY